MVGPGDGRDLGVGGLESNGRGWISGGRGLGAHVKL